MEANCIRQYKTQREELELISKRSKVRIVFWSPTLLEMLSEFSAFLSALRILQNQVVPLVAQTLEIKKNVSKSMNNAMKKIDDYGLPQNIVNKLKTYWWSKSGRRVKDYRDIDQHFSSIIHHSLLEDDKEPKLLVLLPDNPEVKDPQKFTYQQEINALPFFEQAFHELHDLFEQMGKEVGAERKVMQQGIRFAQLGELEHSVRRTIGLIIEDPITCSGIVVGQTEDRKITARQILGKPQTDNNGRGRRALGELR